MLGELEKKVLTESCELNENITLSIKDDGKMFVYKSRFLAVDFKQGSIIIDRPSAETVDARPLLKGTHFDIFFTYKSFRYLFPSALLEHTKFNLQGNEIYAARIYMPAELQDGEKREYFRVQAGMRPPVSVKFFIYEKGSETPIMSKLVEDTPKEFHAQLVDISGGGISLRTKPGEKPFLMEKGDIIKANFKLKKEMEEMEIWCEVRNKRRYKDTEIVIWGLRFIESEKNRQLKFYRNKIMRYVVERQREMLAK